MSSYLDCSSPCQYCCLDGFCASSSACGHKSTIVYIVVALVIVFVVACGIYLYCRYQKRQKQRAEFMQKRQELANRRGQDAQQQYYQDADQSGLENSFGQIGMPQQQLYQNNIMAAQYPSNFAYNQGRIDPGIPIQQPQRSNRNGGSSQGYDQGYNQGYY